MREFSPETAEQLRAQLERATAGQPARGWEKGKSPAEAGERREAVVEATFLMAAVDGKVTALELGQFAGGIEAVFGDEAGTDFEALAKTMAARLAAEGWDRRLAAVKAALAGTDLAETAYRLAAGVAFVDDTIEHAAAAALEAMAGALGLSEERAQALLAEVRTELFGE